MTTPTTSALKKYEPILKKLIPIVEEVKKKCREESCGFNLFDLFDPSETMHSKILFHLLDPKGNHGQEYLFLHGFLKRIGIEPQEGNWKVTRENEGIDIYLERKNPESIVIIENKSNGACDQESQLYRYWYKKMHQGLSHEKQGDEKALRKFYTEKEKRYKIVYLTRDGSKEPSENTLKCPPCDSKIKDDAPKNPPLKLPLEPLLLTFTDLADKRVFDLTEIHENNHRLKEYLKQYMDHLLSKNTVSVEIIKREEIFSAFEDWSATLELAERFEDILKDIQNSWLEGLFEKLKDLKIDERWIARTASDQIDWCLKEKKYKNAPLKICLRRDPGEVTWGISLTHKPTGISERKRIAHSLYEKKYKALKSIFGEIDTTDKTDNEWWPAWWKISLKSGIHHTDVELSEFLWHCQYRTKDVLSQMDKNLKNVFAQTELFIDLIREIKK